MSIIPLQWRLHNPFRGQLTLGFYSLIPADLSTAWFLLCQTSSGSRNCSQWPPSGTSVLMPGSQNWKAKLLLAYAQGAGSVHQGLPWPCLGHEGWFVQGWPLIIHSRGTDPHQQEGVGSRCWWCWWWFCGCAKTGAPLLSAEEINCCSLQ